MTKILYVEDNEENIYMLSRRLKKKGFEIVIARDGEEGIELAQKESPDLILMDFRKYFSASFDSLFSFIIVPRLESAAGKLGLSAIALR